MRFFITAKAWQLFLALMGVYAVQVISMLSTPNFILGFGIPTVLMMGLIVGWLWSVGTAANERLPEALRKSPRLFVFSAVYAPLYALAFVVIVGLVREAAFPLIIPFHLAAVFCMFYMLWFAAKQLMTLEKQQLLSFEGYGLQFFQAWFFPFGIWFFQPRVNRLLGQQQD